MSKKLKIPKGDYCTGCHYLKSYPESEPNYYYCVVYEDPRIGGEATLYKDKNSDAIQIMKCAECKLTQKVADDKN